MIKRKIKIEEDKCIGCGLCANACKENAIELVDGKAKVVREDYCDGLGNCLPVCPTNAISFDPPMEDVQWPLQIKLLSPEAPFFEGSNLMVAADCTAFAYPQFYEKFKKNYVTIIGCPKLDMEDYSEKLAEILRKNDVANLTVVRMEVPCCGGMEYAAQQAIEKSGKDIQSKVITVSLGGKLI